MNIWKSMHISQLSWKSWTGNMPVQWNLTWTLKNNFQRHNLHLPIFHSFSSSTCSFVRDATIDCLLRGEGQDVNPPSFPPHHFLPFCDSREASSSTWASASLELASPERSWDGQSCRYLDVSTASVYRIYLSIYQSITYLMAIIIIASKYCIYHLLIKAFWADSSHFHLEWARLSSLLPKSMYLISIQTIICVIHSTRGCAHRKGSL